MLRKIVIIIAALLTCSSLMAQNFRENVSKRGTTAAAFLEIGVGARALGMGGAFTAIANDPSTMFWNVAGIAKMQQNGVIFNHSEWIADTRFDYMAGVLQMGQYGALGVSVTTLGMNEMDVTTVDMPEGTGQTFTAGDYAISIGYAINLSEEFAIGFNPKYIHQYIWEMSATGFAIDVGVHYKTPFKNLQLGFALTNFGSKMQMTGDNARVLYDFDPNSTGNNDRITALLETSKWALPLNFTIGLAYQLVQTSQHSATISFDAQHPNNDYESVNIGAEYQFYNRLAVRAGYRNLFLDGNEETFTLGMGLNYPILGNIMLHFDFAYADFGLLENVQKYSIGIDF